jgi:hypothetical protein
LPAGRSGKRSRVKIDEDNIFTVLTFGSIVLTCAVCAVALLSGAYRFAGGVAAGGTLALANFYWLLSAMKRVLVMPAAKAGSFAQVRHLLRLGATGFVLYLLIVKVGVSIIGLLVGLSVLMINIVLLAVYKMTLKGG